MKRYTASHAQELKEGIWLMRASHFCGAYRPSFILAVALLIGLSSGL